MSDTWRDIILNNMIKLCC